ncbi:hypothetical protein KC343_g12616 [Hortaea werneckii]|nr:hypothetical protein KC317_g8439 [Hortaea werneckii]KAI7600149.1 hypothetical protein KC346_g13396 [Hortaea werneckii]KAI7608667.1 hypothetical protein KC343_g12616 [Hortaea werneckii]KAI7678800.1 hypothetical protein KC319_g3118 [Hortaea werneckii]KAI7701131.1 hypothetical protein KC322_g8013 [Hortaea werneckii]
MNPPVSDAIQGAYMVAAVITGLIFGALALIFKEVTEGLGCLLGGFCLAMWLLVLSPGGLVTSTSGLPIFIVAFCLAAFALSFSHYTRNYGLIFCTSFAGAQVAILGVDCFSRAGLKEFWIYIWDLNDGEFPINTDTYPVTRGIKVEIACTFIIFVFGALSQLKIWKIVRERRAKKVAERTREDENRNELEEAVGREIETNNERDRARWEAVYGDKDQAQVHIDSAMGSSIGETDRKHSTSVREREIEVADADVPETVSIRSSKQKEKPLVTVEPASEDGMSERSSTPSRDHPLEETRTSPTGSQRSTMQLDVQDSETQDPPQASSTRDGSQDRGIDPGPGVTPLPFSIPGKESDEVRPSSEKGSETSERASYSSEQTTGAPLTHRALQKVAELASRVPSIDDDRASSVAATADDETDAGMLSPKRLSMAASPQPSRTGTNITESLTGAGKPAEPESRHSIRRSFIEIPVEEDDEEAVVRPAAVLDDPQPVDVGVAEPELQASSPADRQALEEQTTLNNGGVRGVASLSDHLPPEMSKVAMTYRTNEWAKHITEADTPDADAPSRPSSPGVQVDYEEPVKVDVDALRPEPENSVRNSSQRPKPMLHRQSSQATSTSETPLHASRSSSAMQISRQNSSISTKSRSPNTNHGFRNSSTPLSALPLYETPGEDAPAGSRSFSTPMKTASVNNLMDVRNERMLRKPTSMSFNRVSSTPDLKANYSSNFDTGRSSRLEVPANTNISLGTPVPEEEMTLAERKAMMQQQQQLSPRRDPSRASVRQDTWPKQGHTSMTANPNIIYDSHQPKRNNTVDSTRQSHMLAQWRESLQQDAASRSPLRGDEQAHLAMVNERRQTQIHNQAQETQREKRQSAMDLAMRSGQLNNAHRDRLRKMQAQANRRTPQ